MFEDEDDIMDALAGEIAKDESGVFISNPERIRSFADLYCTIRDTAKGGEVKVTYAMHQPFPSMGYVSLTGKGIEVTDPTLFAKAAKLASNVEVYPLTNGKIKIDFTFHGLMVKAGDIDE